MMDLFEYSAGRAKKEAGLDLVSSNNPEYLAKARSTAEYIAQTRGEVSINDVRRYLGDPPSGINPNVLGAVFRGKHWRKVGHTQTTHAAGHARTVGVYVYVTDQGGLA
jgi:hypothetical protein